MSHMLHALLNLMLLVIALASFGAIAFIAAGECSLRAKQRRDGGLAQPDDVARVPCVCVHPNEALDTSLYSKVAFRCLDCGTVRILGEVWFGANNFKKRSAA